MPPTLFLSLIIRKTQDHLIQFTKTILNTKTAVSLQYVYIGGKMKSEKKKSQIGDLASYKFQISRIYLIRIIVYCLSI